MIETTYDMVIPFVDNQDPVWQRIFIDYCNKHKLYKKIADLHTDRYEDIGLINFQLKLINKYLPWINKIYLLLMNREQAPKNLPSNVEIVYHGKFIPPQFLPTFNSCTIEMFLWNIPNLSEHFIYANDDMLPFRTLSPCDFFDIKSGKIKIEWWEEDLNECYNMFRLQCFNSYKHIATRLGKKLPNGVNFLRPAHSFTPMIKSHCKLAFELVKDIAYQHIRAFRTEYQYNQYIYPLFEYFTIGTLPSKLDFVYTQCKEETLDFNHDIVCINIVPKDKEKQVIEMLRESVK